MRRLDEHSANDFQFMAPNSIYGFAGLGRSDRCMQHQMHETPLGNSYNNGTTLRT